MNWTTLTIMVVLIIVIGFLAPHIATPNYAVPQMHRCVCPVQIVNSDNDDRYWDVTHPMCDDCCLIKWYFWCVVK